MSASSWAAIADEGVLATVEPDPDRWARFVEHRIRACREPGALDGGTHLLVALTHRP